MILPGILILFSIQVLESNPSPVVPEATGIYFRENNSTWVSLRPAVVSDASASGMKLFVYTGAYTDMAMTITCQGPRSPVRIHLMKPVLFIRGIGSAKDTILVRMKQKKDSRVVKTTFSNVTVENKGGFSKRDIYKLVVSEYPDGSFSVSPEKKLPPGEYLLVLGDTSPAYDFGIDRSE